MTKPVKSVKDFSGGLSEVTNDNIPNNCLIKAKNAAPGDGFGIARATGTSIAYDKIPASGPVVMLTELAIGDVTHIIACTENEAYWDMWDWDGESWTQTNEEDMLPMLDWFVYAGKLFWLDGAAYRYYDGAEIADVENTNDQSVGFWVKIQTAIAVELRKSRWFFATRENEVIVSEVGYWDKFNESSIINVNAGVADTITALHQFNDGILVFQRRSIWYLTGWDITGGTDITLNRLSVESGTQWPKSIKTISNAVLFMGDGGVYSLAIPYFTSAIATKNISEKQVSRRLTKTTPTDVCAEIFNGVYYLTLRTRTEVLEYRYHLDAKSWWGEYTQRPYCYGARLAGDPHLYIGCENGYVLYYDPASYHYVATATGGIATIPLEIRTKGYDVVGRMVVDSKVKRVFMVLKQYDAERSGLEVQIKTDYAEGAYAARVDSMKGVLTAVLEDVQADESMVWSESDWGDAYWGWIDPVTKTFPVNRRCKRAQFIIRDDNSDEPLTVYGIAIQYKRKKPKGSRTGVTARTVRYND